MTIEAKGIKFKPLIWRFNCGGTRGKIFFLVPKGTFNPGTNNGACALENIPPSTISGLEGFFSSMDEWNKYQLVHVVAPDNTEQYTMEDLLKATANFIATKLQ
jgi:hypothetical protein